MDKSTSVETKELSLPGAENIYEPKKPGHTSLPADE